MKIKALRAPILGLVGLSLITFGTMSASATAPDGGSNSSIDRSDDIGPDGLKRRGDGSIDDSQPADDSMDDSTVDRQHRGRGRGRGRGGDHADRSDRSGRADHSDRADRSGRSERTERAERADRPERAERAERSDRSSR